MSESVVVEELTKTYGDLKAVDGVTFSVKSGEIFGMLGPNGAGKSTTIECIVGLRKRDGGKVRVLGLDPEKEPEKLKARIGVQLQTPSLYPRLTVKEVVTLFASFYPNPLPVMDVVDKVGLRDKINSQVRQLSGGQLQRLAVAVAIVNDGELVFLDEPTTGLDPQSRRNLWSVIQDLKSSGKTVFLTTHYMEEAERLCDNLVVVDCGKIIAQGSPRELIRQHFKDRAIEFSRPEIHVDDSALERLPGVSRMTVRDDAITLYTSNVPETIDALMNYANSHGHQVQDFSVRQATLEDVFLKITGRRIRE